MKRVLIATLASLSFGVANAATTTWEITGGAWTSLLQWNDNANGLPSPIFDSNTAQPVCVLGANPCTLFGLDFIPPITTLQNGTYGGSLVVDNLTGEVVGGSLVVNGTIGDMILVGGNSWWYREYTDLVINFNTMKASAGSVACYFTTFAPVDCDAILFETFDENLDLVLNLPTDVFGPIAGKSGQPAAGVVERFAAQFTLTGPTSGVLEVFRDGRNLANPNGTDVLNTFNLTVVPVPAAVWLFASALGLMGFIRRRAAVA